MQKKEVEVELEQKHPLLKEEKQPKWEELEQTWETLNKNM